MRRVGSLTFKVLLFGGGDLVSVRVGGSGVDCGGDEGASGVGSAGTPLGVAAGSLGGGGAGEEGEESDGLVDCFVVCR